jgi:hypothetical protein
MLYNRAFDSTTGEDPKITPTKVDWDLTVDGTIDADANWIDKVYATHYECPLDVTIYKTGIVFNENQLNTEYYVRYYKKPTELLDESKELQVPDEYVDVLEEGVNAYIEYSEHGDRQNYLLWKRTELKQFKWAMNKQYRWDDGILNGKKTVYTPYETL